MLLPLNMPFFFPKLMVIQSHNSVLYICHDCGNCNYIGKLRLVISLYILQWDYLQILVMRSLLLFFNVYTAPHLFSLIGWYSALKDRKHPFRITLGQT